MENMIVTFILLLFYLSSVALSDPGACSFPAFSHDQKDAWSWIRTRNEYSSSKPTQVRDWSKYGKIKPLNNVNATQQFLSWLDDTENKDLYRNVIMTHTERPKIKNQGSSRRRRHVTTTVAATDMEEGDSLLYIPIHYCISDQLSREDPSSLKGSPWELRLATKILRERRKSTDSAWYSFINLLPSLIRLPLFFTESELSSCEDPSVLKEVKLLRNFSESSFDVLQKDETGGASFSDYVWALAVVYTSATACRGNNFDHSSGLTHLLIPFFGTCSDPLSIRATVELEGEKLKMVMMQKSREGSFICLSNDARTSKDSFLYHGFVPANLPHDNTRIFENLQDLVDWYLLTHGEQLHHSKDFIIDSIKSAVQTQDDCSWHDVRPDTCSTRNEYSIGSNGHIDNNLLCALVALSYLKDHESANSDTEGDLNGPYEWFASINYSALPGELGGTLCKNRDRHAMQSNEKKALVNVIQDLKKRLLDLLDLSHTTLEEDEALLSASIWEGFSDDDDGSHLCETCQWQTEELSLNDYLALQFRVRRKYMLIQTLSALSFNQSMKNYAPAYDTVVKWDFDDIPLQHSQEFLNWCKIHGARISEKLAVVLFPEDPAISSSSNNVRGIQALQDVQQGETICILPLKLGLFEKNVSGADSWHLAAARLLRERSLGSQSHWAPYISVLPKIMSSPIYLTSSELNEIQWWPLVRELIQVRRAIRKSYSQLTGVDLAGADFEQYRWAALMVHSRAFTLPVEDDDEYASYVLMPFMDMINHHYEYQADWMSVPVRDGKLEIVAKKGVHKGQELFASFGPRSNDNLFLYYGFVLENNPFDTVQIFPTFQDAVEWFTEIWHMSCDELHGEIEKDRCTRNYREEMWMKAHKAIEDYSAGVTDQRPEWWKLVNTWADYGYEYMQFQPSPSIYANGIVDPSLLVGLETVGETLDIDIVHTPQDCKEQNCNSIAKPLVANFMSCMHEGRLPDAKWALHSSICSEYIPRALKLLDKRYRSNALVKISLSIRCLEILNSFPTTIEEDKLLLMEDNHVNAHILLTRRYRYIKKLFLKNFIDQVVASIGTSD